MRSSVVVIVLFAFCALRLVIADAPDATIRSSYIRISDRSEDGNKRNYDPYPQDSYYYPIPKRSYIIYDGDVDSLPNARDRPLMLGTTRAWHLEFNQRRRTQPQQSNQPVTYNSIYSNLIQVYDEPQENYYGGKPYPERTYPNYPRPRPEQVPKYDVIYPYEAKRKNPYYNEKIPASFPTPFSPNSKFEFKDPPPPVGGPRKDFGLFRTQTINYGNQESSEDRRGSRTEQCNYIRFNEKGFPVGNEMCGRSISDIILAPDYSTTGELILEHRKQYRGNYHDRSIQTRQMKGDAPPYNRRKRSADIMADRFGSFNSFPSGGCCGEAGGSTSGGYGYRPYFGYPNNNREFGYDTVDFMSRPYQSDRGSYRGYGYQDGGQDYENGYNRGDDVGEETSDNRGLTSYLTSKGRGDRGRFKDSEENNGDSEEENNDNRGGSGYSGSSRGSWGSSGSRGNDRTNSQGRKSNSNSRNNHRNQTSNRNSNNSDRTSSDGSSQGNSRNYYNRRNFGNSNGDSGGGGSGGGYSEDSGNDGYDRRSNGGNNNYDYQRSRDGGRSSSNNNGYYGGSLGGSSYRGSSGGNSYGSSLGGGNYGGSLGGGNYGGSLGGGSYGGSSGGSSYGGSAGGSYGMGRGGGYSGSNYGNMGGGYSSYGRGSSPYGYGS